MYAALDRTAHAIAWLLAMLGGAILIGIIVLTCASIIGRALVPLNIGIGPIRGIYDLTEMGMAAAVFAFLPWCQYKQGHATVELASALFPRTFDILLSLLFNSAMTVVAVVGTWRLYLGMQDKLTYGETTLIAQIPVWYGFAASLVGGCGFIIVSAFCVLRYARALMRRNTLETGHV